MVTARKECSTPLAHLRALPFIRNLHFHPAKNAGDQPADGAVELTTSRGRHRLSVEVKRSYLDRGLVNAILSRALAATPSKGRTRASAKLVLARYIPTAVGEQFIDAGICFADDQGNIHLRLGAEYNWTVLGKREPHRLAEANRTTPATIQLLFQFAVEPRSATCSSGIVTPAFWYSRQTTKPPMP